MTKPLRIAFMGTPDFVVPTLHALIDSAHNLTCVYTQPPRPSGRKQKIQYSPVHVAAEEANIEVRTPHDFKQSEDVEAFEALDLDVAIVAAYGMLLPDNILNAPKHCCLNIHPSLLPRWRGPSPIQYAIWNGDPKTGVSVMQLEKKMDAGPIVAQSKIPITQETNFENLNADLWTLGTEMTLEALNTLSKNGQLATKPQSEDGITYCKLLTKEHGRIDWNRNATEIDCQIRGLNPKPGTWCVNANGSRLKVLTARVSNEKTQFTPGTIIDTQGSIACGDGSVLQLHSIQPEGKKPMDIAAAFNGSFIKDGDILT